MSEIGILAGGYQRLREYARSVDRLLLDLKSSIVPIEETVAPVVTLLEAMQDDAGAAPAVQLLHLRWKERSNITPARIARMVSELRTQNVGPQTVEELEELASLLDQERADMRFRLRGV